MKSRTFLTWLILLILMTTAVNSLASEGHDDDHGAEVTDHCDTPTAELMIEADPTANAYTQDEYNVEKNTCYELKFKNPSTVEHDATIDAVGDHDSEVHIEKVHIHVANNTDGHDHNGVKSMHILTPDADTELTLYCTVEGHLASGMEATIIVGEGETSSLPFNAFYAFFALTLLVGISTYRSKQ